MIIGFFNVYKEKGMTSAAAVGKLKRILRQKGLGHMGTLDPMAEGVLPIAAGRPATKMFDLLRAKKKEYAAEFTFGILTDTLDTTGKITAEGGHVPSEAEIRAVLPRFLGRISQLPPDYSAKSVGGVRAYDLARRGAETNLKPVEIKIYEYELTGNKGGGVFGFRILCGGGTYIRALARDLGTALGTHCVMSALTRTKSGCFTVEDARTLKEIEENPEAAVVGVEKVREELTDEK
ncbi:hypothetical protein FACS1894211_07000 [Clostridia bacterium]|nr:hypothetical protein FACS1894211_07000 [Clostridia bacterium]